MALLAIGFANTSVGNTIRVPDDEPTIQGAINAASPGDTVLIRCGTYYEYHIEMRPQITVRSETGDASCVTIEAPMPGTVIYCPPGIELDTKIEGLTLTKGGISYGAGGMSCFNASPTVVNCTFLNNGLGGDQLSMRAGGVLLMGSHAQFTDCLFTNNIRPAMVAWGCPDLLFTNCTFYGNRRHRSQGSIFIERGSHVTFRNCIVAFNLGSIECAAYYEPSKVELQCCNIYGNGEDWASCIADQKGQNGNLSLDPLFCAAESGDWHLCSDSPCAPEEAGGCGLIGALPVGCAACGGPQALEPSTWGRIKHQAKRPSATSPKAAK